MIYSSKEDMEKDLNFQKSIKPKLERRIKKLQDCEGKSLEVHEKGEERYYYVVDRKKVIESKSEQATIDVAVDSKSEQATIDAEVNSKSNRNQIDTETKTNVKSDGKYMPVYLGKEENEQVKRIQEYKYLRKALKICNKNICALEGALKKYEDIDPYTVTEGMGKAYRGNRDVGAHIFARVNNLEWVKEGLEMRSCYDDVRPFPQDLVLQTASGEMVRTRGEVIIANTLDSFGLSYVYEWPKIVAGILRWPDFTVLHPKTKEEITIEYMGRYDDPGYREKNNPRLEEFFSEGYILGQNLLIFMDDANGIINSKKINNAIKAYFIE